MKTIVYILAAIGLMFIGAIVSDVLNSHHDGHVNSREVEAVQILSGNGVSPEVARSIQQSQIESLVVGKSLPAQTAIVHGTWAQLAVIAMGGLFLMVLALTAVLVLKRVLHGNPAHREGDAAVQELYHLGKNLETRMDALETILLERQRPANDV